VQRVQPAKAADQELHSRSSIDELSAKPMPDHEAAEHEEKIDRD
jgi:hypothetical protein